MWPVEQFEIQSFYLSFFPPHKARHSALAMNVQATMTVDFGRIPRVKDDVFYSESRLARALSLSLFLSLTRSLGWEAQ